MCSEPWAALAIGGFCPQDPAVSDSDVPGGRGFVLCCSQAALHGSLACQLLKHSQPVCSVRLPSSVVEPNPKTEAEEWEDSEESRGVEGSVCSFISLQQSCISVLQNRRAEQSLLLNLVPGVRCETARVGCFPLLCCMEQSLF